MSQPIYFERLSATQRRLTRLEQIADMMLELKCLLKHNRSLCMIKAPLAVIHQVGSKYIINDGHHRLAALYLSKARYVRSNEEDAIVCELTASRRITGDFTTMVDRYELDILMAIDKNKLSGACDYSKKYSGLRYPKCDEGYGCQACWEKYIEVQKRKSLEEARPLGSDCSRLITDLT